MTAAFSASPRLLPLLLFSLFKRQGCHRQRLLPCMALIHPPESLARGPREELELDQQALSQFCGAWPHLQAASHKTR